MNGQRNYDLYTTQLFKKDEIMPFVTRATWSDYEKWDKSESELLGGFLLFVGCKSTKENELAKHNRSNP